MNPLYIDNGEDTITINQFEPIENIHEMTHANPDIFSVGPIEPIEPIENIHEMTIINVPTIPINQTIPTLPYGYRYDRHEHINFCGDFPNMCFTVILALLCTSFSLVMFITLSHHERVLTSVGNSYARELHKWILLNGLRIIFDIIIVIFISAYFSCYNGSLNKSNCVIKLSYLLTWILIAFVMFYHIYFLINLRNASLDFFKNNSSYKKIYKDDYKEIYGPNDNYKEIYEIFDMMDHMYKYDAFITSMMGFYFVCISPFLLHVTT
jgi:hypothetical protein